MKINTKSKIILLVLAVIALFTVFTLKSIWKNAISIRGNTTGVENGQKDGDVANTQNFVVSSSSTQMSQPKTVEKNNVINSVTISGVDSNGNAVDKTMSYEEYVVWTRKNLIVPEFKTIPVIPKSFSDEARVLIEQKFKNSIGSLSVDPYVFESWIDLSGYRQMVSDYKGSEEALLFANKLSPKNSLAYNNLGYLYGYLMHDNAKAEISFLAAIENGPNTIQWYYQTAEFYKTIIKDLSKARAIVEKGIKVNPNATTDLNTLLWSLQDPIKK